MKTASKVSLAEFEAMFEAVKNWGRWGPDDEKGTLNYITPDHVKRAAGLVRSGRSISMAIPINIVAGPDNPHPAIHYMTQMHDWDIGSGKLRFAISITSPTAIGCMADARRPMSRAREPRGWTSPRMRMA